MDELPQPITPQAPETPTIPPFAERIKAMDADLAELLKKHHLDMGITMDFPLYRQLPPEVQLALLIIEKHSGVYKTNYVDVKETV